MPIRIPDSLPATEVLEGENIFVMTEYRAMHQDIRPLRRRSCANCRTPRCKSR